MRPLMLFEQRRQLSHAQSGSRSEQGAFEDVANRLRGMTAVRVALLCPGLVLSIRLGAVLIVERRIVVRGRIGVVNSLPLTGFVFGRLGRSG